ncbi:hypothetical protein N7493_000963 [Penicillium malachiteum]|uniref:Uncharacterized protein n=1 Tax=Penicillium malachiteum TaxID=1324776 RepID=A0AAD6HXA8_9EURO|nr:hypothetical protein N7493_000963 [Penicillium malachiteum]
MVVLYLLEEWGRCTIRVKPILCGAYWNNIYIKNVPISKSNRLLGLAKEQARATTHKDALVQTPHFQENILDSFTIAYRRKKQAYSLNSRRAWLDLMDTSLRSIWLRQINVHADKPEKRGGQCTGQDYYNVRTLIEATYPTFSAASRQPTTRTRRQTWKQCEPPYGLQSPRVDLTSYKAQQYGQPFPPN